VFFLKRNNFMWGAAGRRPAASGTPAFVGGKKSIPEKDIDGF
jgi:hypothetical protein